MKQIFICLLVFVTYSTAQAKQPVDLLIAHATIVTMDSQRRILEDAALAITGEAITAIGPTDQLTAAYEARKNIDAQGALLMPGLINAHTHMAMSFFRGLAEDRSLQEWLQKFIFPAEARNVTPDFVTWSTRLSVLEMLRGGTTTAADMYYFEEEVAPFQPSAPVPPSAEARRTTTLSLPVPVNNLSFITIRQTPRNWATNTSRTVVTRRTTQRRLRR